ncbi:hypothetical protein ACLOJK_030052 [Asimina triloba]
MHEVGMEAYLYPQIKLPFLRWPLPMASLSVLQPFLLILFLLHLQIPYSSAQQQTDDFVYNGFSGSAQVSLTGSAVLHPNGLLQLTNSSKRQMGRMFHPSPLKFKSSRWANAPSFSTSFVSAIIPAGPRNLSGHGIAFVISPSNEFPGALAAQFMGLFSPSTIGKASNHVFLVELDTILNPEFGGMNNNHVGISVNGMKSNASAAAAYYDDRDGKNKSLSLIGGEPVLVWVDYDGVKKQINVTVSPWKIPKPNIPLLSAWIDLSEILLENMHVGFSSSTGTITGSHYLLGWSFKMNGNARPLSLSLLPPVPRQTVAEGNERWKIWLSLAASAVAVAASFFGILYAVKKRKYVELREDWEQEYGPHRFLYRDLAAATKRFSDEELLGVGGFGKVYKGVLPTSAARVAVKVRQISDEHDAAGLKEFVAEIASMGRLRHRNLVQLLGYCRCKGRLLLVYDLMPNGSLDKFLFSNHKPLLSWDQRYRILRGVASGLLYLHEEWDQVVLHRDIKASNVLLDADFNGLLGDFGLARWYDHGANPQTTHVVGTLGYLAPEYVQTGRATTSTDVFSFGALLLEVACGRRPASLAEEEMVLVDWVLEKWRKGSIAEARDGRLGEKYVAEELDVVLKLGVVCSHPIPGARPSMRQVMQYLDGDAILADDVLEGIGDPQLHWEDSGADSVQQYSPTLETGLPDHQVSGAEPLLPRSC